jgi:oxygen-independent coproporphyrinogen-3 oxidase
VGRTLSGNRPVRVLHLGGGTPTFLSPEEIDRLMRGLRRRLPLEPELEFSVEVDPRVTSVEHLEALRVHGLNRLSLGVQDFDPRVQEAIGRHQSLESTSAVYDAARRLGIESIHFDLVYGLPRQTIDSFARTVETLVAMRPDRIALYAYAHLPDARPHQRAIDAATLPRGYEKLELFLLARDALVGARPENELAIAAERRALARNFMGYTPHAGIEIAGLGVSSIGDVGRAYVQNQKRLAPYYRAVHQGGFAVERGLWQSVCDLERRWLIHRLLCRFRIEAEEFQSQFGEALWERYARERGELDAFVEDGLVEFKGDDVEVTPSGRLFARNIAMVFDAYLRRGDAVPSADRFSRTV